MYGEMPLDFWNPATIHQPSESGAKGIATPQIRLQHYDDIPIYYSIAIFSTYSKSSKDRNLVKPASKSVEPRFDLGSNDV